MRLVKAWAVLLTIGMLLMIPAATMIAIAALRNPAHQYRPWTGPAQTYTLAPGEAMRVLCVIDDLGPRPPDNFARAGRPSRRNHTINRGPILAQIQVAASDPGLVVRPLGFIVEHSGEDEASAYHYAIARVTNDGPAPTQFTLAISNSTSYAILTSPPRPWWVVALFVGGLACGLLAGLLWTASVVIYLVVEIPKTIQHWKGKFAAPAP